MQLITKTLIQPTPEQLNEIYTELGTSEAKINVDVKTIAEWMRKQPHLPDPKVDERRIQMYLMLCKNSLERTKEALDQYYTMKATFPEFFIDRDPTSSSLNLAMKTSIFIPLPKLTADGCRVSMCRLRNTDIDNFDFLNISKVNFMGLDMRLSLLDMYKKEIFIYDLNKFTMSHLTAVLPLIKKYINCALTAYPLRIHQVHVINIPSYAQPLVTMVMGILKKKVANRVMIHNSVDDLKKHLSLDVLPLDYGGTFPKTSDEINDEWIEEFLKHKDWFSSQNSIASDESKRIEKPTDKMNIMTGVEGSFRKLEVD